MNNNIEKKEQEEVLPEIELIKDPFGGVMIKRMEIKTIPHKVPLPQNESFAHGCVVGTTGSGKSTILLNIVLKYINLSGIVVMSLIEGLPIYDQIHAWCKQEKINYHFSSDVQEGYKMVMDEINTKKEGTHTLIIADDLQTGRSMKSSSNTPENRMLLHLFSKARNYFCSVIMITQSYVCIPPNIRTNLNWMATFKMTNTSATQMLKNDLKTMTNWSKEVINECFKILGNTPHSYLLFTKEPKVWFFNAEDPEKKLKPLQIKEDDEDNFDIGSFPFDELMKRIESKSNNTRKVAYLNFLQIYLQMYIQFTSIDRKKLYDYMKQNYDIEIY